MIFLLKAIVQYTVFKTLLLYLLKVYPSYEHCWNQPKKMIKLQFCNILFHIPGITSYNLGYVQNQSQDKITLYFRQWPVCLYLVRNSSISVIWCIFLLTLFDLCKYGAKSMTYIILLLQELDQSDLGSHCLYVFWLFGFFMSHLHFFSHLRTDLLG